MAAANHVDDTRISQISVESLKFKNYDPKAYQDADEIEKERAELALSQANVQAQEDGEYHAADIMSHKIKMHMEAQNRQSLTYIDSNDDKKDLMYKHYKTI